MKAAKSKRQDPLVLLEALSKRVGELGEDLQRALELLREERQRADVDDGELIGPKEAASLLGCSQRTVRRWARAGTLPPPISLGRTPKWRRGEIEALVRREGAA